MTSRRPASAPAASPALDAFLRGVGRRAIVLAELQCGDPQRAVAALAAMLPRFVAEAGDRPMPQWPPRFWHLLLAATPLRAAPSVEQRWPPGLDALGRLGPGPRSALLLWLVAGLQEDDAAAALGVDAATWRSALQRATPRRPDGAVNVEAWQALAAASREALQALPDSRLERWGRACDAAVAQASVPAPAAIRPRWLLPALWTGVAACAIALAATFAWPAAEIGVGDAATTGPLRVPLPASVPPAATFDAAFALRTHPDLAQLAGADESLLRDLDLLSWHAVQVAAQATTGAAPAPAARASVPVRGDALQQRVAGWDALSPAERGARRERWQAWQALPAAQRAAVLDAGARFDTLLPQQQQALRLQFAQLSHAERRGWLLGPTLGAAWPRLEPLLMQVPAAQRQPLLAALHGLSPLQLDDLATLAQRTPPQDRDALRRELLASAPGDRSAWLRERLRR